VDLCRIADEAARDRGLIDRAGLAVGVHCRLLLLDRGFYSAGVIRYLQAARHPFLMPVICRGRKLDDPRGPSGTNVFLAWEKSGWGTYTLHDVHRRPARVSIALPTLTVMVPGYLRNAWRRQQEPALCATGSTGARACTAIAAPPV